ncbi:ABC transporter transmembrane domain-containing protein [Kineosporia succinea]|uniref:ABC-type multidrug transport system fused ATPase/permease subunit n=1 Tax=Kineosporia succinea TaxID=84632 RepID=A0ABT9P3K9_9ACTN|nr:ABC transporter ATP-binding protein [Kineosporia succinea]MDP9827253.1 ABC-type multidrug transport system fused ATPase/permease subunit [Kineosporia succinea]
MITLPDPVPPRPSVDSPVAYIRSMAALQRRTLAGAALFGVLWMGAQAVIPVVVGNTIDAGLVLGRTGDLVRGCVLLAVLALATAFLGTVRHRFAVSNWLLGGLRSQHRIGHHVADHGLAVSGRVTTGEVVQSVSTDAPRFADLMDIAARGAGTVVTFLAMAVYLLRIDLVIGLFVVIGMPLLAAASLGVIRPLQKRQALHREREGELTTLGADTVAGLRVLRGIGGEEQFTGRYTERSQEVRRAGVRVAGPQAVLQAAQVLLPGAFLTGLTWLAGHGVVDGRLSVGDLVTVYAVTAFLKMPLETATQVLSRWVRAKVAVSRMVAVLSASEAPSAVGVLPDSGSLLHDPESGLTITPGLMTALVSAEPCVALADRFGGFAPGALLGDRAVEDLPADQVRARILLSEAEPRLFTGTLRSQIDPFARHSDEEVLEALHTADALDVLSGLPEGLSSMIAERGRDLSGGQRQRLALARAVLLAGQPSVEVLVLVEPTSAVDAHTEARIAERLRASRVGCTTVLVSSSPLVLDRCDRVEFLDGGRVVASGTHRSLLASDAGYRDVVVRTASPDASPPSVPYTPSAPSAPSDEVVS